MEKQENKQVYIEYQLLQYINNRNNFYAEFKKEIESANKLFAPFSASFEKSVKKELTFGEFLVLYSAIECSWNVKHKS